MFVLSKNCKCVIIVRRASNKPTFDVDSEQVTSVSSESDSDGWIEEWNTDSDTENWGYCHRCKCSKKFCPSKNTEAYWRKEEYRERNKNVG